MLAKFHENRLKLTDKSTKNMCYRLALAQSIVDQGGIEYLFSNTSAYTLIRLLYNINMINKRRNIYVSMIMIIIIIIHFPILYLLINSRKTPNIIKQQ